MRAIGECSNHRILGDDWPRVHYILLELGNWAVIRMVPRTLEGTKPSNELAGDEHEGWSSAG